MVSDQVIVVMLRIEVEDLQDQVLSAGGQGNVSKSSNLKEVVVGRDQEIQHQTYDFRSEVNEDQM